MQDMRKNWPQNKLVLVEETTFDTQNIMCKYGLIRDIDKIGAFVRVLGRGLYEEYFFYREME